MISTSLNGGVWVGELTLISTSLFNMLVTTIEDVTILTYFYHCKFVILFRRLELK